MSHDPLVSVITYLPEPPLGEGDDVVNRAVNDESGIRRDTLPRAGLFAACGEQQTLGSVESATSIE